MRCAKCRNEAVFFQPYSGRHLCGRHLVMDIEARAKRTIRSHCWMLPEDHIAVVVSGRRRDAALLSFLHTLTADRRDIRLSAIPAPDNDIVKPGLGAVTRLAESLGIPWTMLPPAVGPAETGDGTITRIATAISLDDIAEGVLARFLYGNAEELIHPSAGGDYPVPVICPFMTIPAGELDLYGEIALGGIVIPPEDPPHTPLPGATAALFEYYCRRHPATKFAIRHLAGQLGNGAVPAPAHNGAAGGDRRQSRQ